MISKACLKAARAKRDILKTLRADPYYLGDEAWHYGQPEKANPFTTGTESHADWLKGWRDAEFETTKARG
jgi:ribosome modulation factor